MKIGGASLEISVKNLKGFKVYDHESSEPWGTVKDVCFDCDPAKVKYFVVETLSLVPIPKRVEFGQINNIIKGAVVLKKDALAKPCKGTAQSDRLSFDNIKKAACPNQKRTRLRDIRFDFETGEMTDFVVSKNIFSPKSHIKVRQISIKENTVYMQSEGGENNV